MLLINTIKDNIAILLFGLTKHKHPEDNMKGGQLKTEMGDEGGGGIKMKGIFYAYIYGGRCMGD